MVACLSHLTFDHVPHWRRSINGVAEEVKCSSGDMQRRCRNKRAKIACKLPKKSRRCQTASLRIVRADWPRGSCTKYNQMGSVFCLLLPANLAAVLVLLCRFSFTFFLGLHFSRAVQGNLSR